MHKMFLPLLALGVLALPLGASAAEFRADETYALPKVETVSGNLYVAGGNLAIDGTVNGDLAAAGGNVIISGTVTKDALVAGGNVTISGTIGEDLRVVGGNVIISGTVNGEVVSAGGQVRLMPGAVVRGDFVAAGDSVMIDGRVEGKVIQPPKRDEKKEREGVAAFLGVLWFAKLLMMIATALVFYYLLRPGTREVITTAESRFWPELLRGFMVLIVVPVAVIVAAVTIIGIPVAFLSLLFYIASLVVGSVIGGILFGSIILRRALNWSAESLTLVTVVIGTILLQIVQLIPFVGWLVSLAFFLAAYGSLTNFIYQHAFRAWRGS